MNKRTRFVILLAVLAICFVFLWPSISWYGRTPKEVQALALGSTENIKDFATAKAGEDVTKIFAKVKEIAANNKEYKANPELFKGNIGDLAEILRISLTGRKNAPNLCAIMVLLGLEESHRRIDHVISLLNK